jgi:hypothetical protein
MMSALSVNPLSQPELEEVYERFETYSAMQHPLDWNHGIVGRILATLRTIEESFGHADFYYQAAYDERAKVNRVRALCVNPDPRGGIEGFRAVEDILAIIGDDRIEFGNGSKILVEQSDAPMRGETLTDSEVAEWNHADCGDDCQSKAIEKIVCGELVCMVCGSDSGCAETHIPKFKRLP